MVSMVRAPARSGLMALMRDFKIVAATPSRLQSRVDWFFRVVGVFREQPVDLMETGGLYYVGLMCSW